LNKTIKRYSENFKLKVLHELESGKYTTYELVKLYGISPGSIYHWIKKYSRFDLMNKQVIIQTMDEKNKIKQLEDQIKQLKELLIEKDLTNITNQVFFEDAVKQLGFKSIEEFKKKVKPD